MPRSRQSLRNVLATDPKTERIIADFPILARPTSRGKRLVYLDSAATSQKPRVVIQALVDYYEQYNANIHRGVYEIAARATAEYEGARVKVARFVGADVPEIVWVRNTTEAINLVAYSWGDANIRPGDAILLTELEHHSDLVPWQLLAQRTGAHLRFIPVDERGLYVLDDLDSLLDGCKLVAVRARQQYARHDSAAGDRRFAGTRRGRPRLSGWSPGRTASAGGRQGARRRLLRI